MPSFTAFYDANVLYPSELRSFLMHLALTGLFRARWSADVHEEWINALLHKDLSRHRAINAARSVWEAGFSQAH